jgi:hypothetical protein
MGSINISNILTGKCLSKIQATEKDDPQRWRCIGGARVSRPIREDELVAYLAGLHFVGAENKLLGERLQPDGCS